MSKCHSYCGNDATNQCYFCDRIYCVEHIIYSEKCGIYICNNNVHCRERYSQNSISLTRSKQLSDKLDNEIKEIKDTIAEMKQMLTDILYYARERAPETPLVS